MADPLLTTTQLGRMLQSARKAKGMTQAAVGARVGLSQKRISALEIAPGTITAEQLLKLCAVLGLELTIGLASQVRDSDKFGW
ncbi:helix-turn-helix domain-containing protein [Ramlibacter albus]|uniref:Helix-turn-helix transcriptional regulator n=1 Tax=Ramlibacter albus TaxID=2079448 RepID=A0A923M7I7_9BURK|nr:helix-turn-helix transcriptional regulator [Ramlibacter albus]MBC5763997.1 helix-turn-helix transcriptional regulator [Ramlibacter albus]